MSTTRILVLGASGMLGNAVFRSFTAASGFATTGTVRSSAALRAFNENERKHIVSDIDVLNEDNLVSLLSALRPDVVINCVGLIKQLSSAKDPIVALPINALFPHRLARMCALGGARVVHISTDCVFSGLVGGYTESSTSDAGDLYGKSKYLGELVDYNNAITLRTSIIGRELNTAHSLVDWFLSQNDPVKGFTKAIFSGLPTCELADVIRDFVIPNRSVSGLYHVSAAPISKFDLLKLIGAEYKKTIEITPDDRLEIDRSLNSEKFKAAVGYVAPGWPELIRRMHAADLRGDN